jgi:CDP-glucose 4,6-dehydratase
LESLELNQKFINRRVLVTGGTGLVGSKLVEALLSKAASVAVIISETIPSSPIVKNGLLEQCKQYFGDLADYHLVERVINDFEPEIVFHLGAQTIVGKSNKNPKLTFESNIQGTWNILEALRLNAPDVESISVASSDKAYGTSDFLPYDETFALHGDGPYDVSKSCTDLIAQSYGHTYNMPVVVARCGNIYGAGDSNWSRIVPGTFKSLLLNQQPVLRSNGTNLRDYIFLDDVVSAYLNLASNVNRWQPGDAFNFSNEKAYSVLEIYREICEVISGEYVQPKILGTAANEIQDQHLSSAKALSILEWKAENNLQSGLRMTAPWYQTLFDGSNT